MQGAPAHHFALVRKRTPQLYFKYTKRTPPVTAF